MILGTTLSCFFRTSLFGRWLNMTFIAKRRSFIGILMVRYNGTVKPPCLWASSLSISLAYCLAACTSWRETALASSTFHKNHSLHWNTLIIQRLPSYNTRSRRRFGRFRHLSLFLTHLHLGLYALFHFKSFLFFRREKKNISISRRAIVNCRSKSSLSHLITSISRRGRFGCIRILLFIA